MSTPESIPAETTSQQVESLIDVNLLREIARKTLVDALNSVCVDEHHSSRLLQRRLGQWNENTGTRYVTSGTSWSHH